jgi:hypothetical protein
MPLDEMQQSLDDLEEQLLADNSDFHKRRLEFESRLQRVLAQGLENQSDCDAAEAKAHLHMLAVKEQKSALSRVLSRVCSAVLTTTESQ